MVQSLRWGFFFFFFWLNDSLVLYRCSLSCAITLCPSHLPLHSSFSPLFLPRPLFVQFNHRAMRPWAPLLLFHHAVTLSGEKCSFIGFLSLFLSLSPLHAVSSHCSLLLPLVSQSLPLSLFIYPVTPRQISPSFSGGFSLCSCPLPHFSGYMSLNLSSTSAAGTKAHSNQISANHKPIGH